MHVGTVLIIGGIVVWLIMYGLTAVFVNRADKDNPYRKLVAGAGYLGLATAGWGVILLLFSG